MDGRGRDELWHAMNDMMMMMREHYTTLRYTLDFPL